MIRPEGLINKSITLAFLQTYATSQFLFQGLRRDQELSWDLLAILSSVGRGQLEFQMLEQ
jgi:hypothetical protein